LPGTADHVAADHRHFEHDGNLSLARDSVWNGARISAEKEWKLYAAFGSQGFNRRAMDCNPAADARGLTPFSGTERISSIRIFLTLDAKWKRSAGPVFSAPSFPFPKSRALNRRCSR